MSESLRDQLLKMGLVKKAEVKKVEKTAYQEAKNVRHHHKKEMRDKMAHSDVTRQIKLAQTEKQTKDQVLNEAKQAALLRKANNAEVRNLIQNTRVNDEQAEISYCFTVSDKIKRIYVTKQQVAALTAGQMAIILFNRRYQLVPISTAERVRVLNPQLFIHIGSESTTANDKDSDYPPIPDDLIW